MAAFVNVQANGGGTEDHWEGELETGVKEIQNPRRVNHVTLRTDKIILQ